MSILIEVNTATLGPSEAHALAGFLDALYPGRAPVAPPAPQLTITAATASPQAIADALIAAESNRVAQAAPAPVPAPPAATTGGPAVPPAPGTTQVAGVTYPVTTAAGVEVDAEGLPWDKRIHSEAKGLLKSGVWKLRRNVDEGMVAQVKHELRQAMNAPPAIPVATGPIVPPAPSGNAGVVPPAPGVAVAPPAPGPVIQVEGGAAPAAVPVSADAFAGATFADLMSKVVDLSVAGVAPEVINGLCAQLGLSQPRDANVRPDLVPQLMALLAPLG